MSEKEIMLKNDHGYYSLKRIDVSPENTWEHELDFVVFTPFNSEEKFIISFSYSDLEHNFWISGIENESSLYYIRSGMDNFENYVNKKFNRINLNDFYHNTVFMIEMTGSNLTQKSKKILHEFCSEFLVQYDLPTEKQLVQFIELFDKHHGSNIKQYQDALINEFNKPFQPIPLERYIETAKIFDNHIRKEIKERLGIEVINMSDFEYVPTVPKM